MIGKIFISELLSNLSRGIFSLSFGLSLYKETGNIFAFSYSYLLEGIIGSFLQLTSGALIDKYSPKRVLILTCFIVPVAIGIVYIISLSTEYKIYFLILITVIIKISRYFSKISMFSLTPSLCESKNIDKINFNGKLSVAFQVGQIGGMIISGILFGYNLEEYIIPLVIFIFFFSAVFTYLSLKDMKEQQYDYTKKDINWPEVICYIKGSKDIKICLFIGTLDYIALGLFNVLLVPISNNNFENSILWLTIFESLFAIGAITGGKYIGKRRVKQLKSTNCTLLCLYSSLLFFVCVYISLSAYFLGLFVFLFGFSLTLSVAKWNANLQDLFKDNMQGRISSIKFMITSIMVSLFVVINSFIFSFGYTNSLIFVSLSIFIFSIIIFFSSRHGDNRY
ncbi:MFS transporter [Xenorhabdus thuongxuanensis]|uniref:MFS transporter n=1 Tax=Xenorhabdus thuongxuanensis TaxID=1873484 RepID=A0A1Q5U165_9GAMM|nr:MFS transporter [Xenorhabdus thuongxuanensis]OKP06222.1 hypothetical protein Xentx_02192 [Xenorhabdus thuongxuanensis]